MGRLQRLSHGQHRRERGAAQWQITREQQDEFASALAAASAEAAQKAGRFKDEIVPVTITSRKGDELVDTDEYPKHGTTVEALAKLRPAFDKDGTVTAGNASGINDGAAAVVLMTAEEARAARPQAAGAHRLLGDGRASIPRSWARARSRRAALALKRPAGRPRIST